MKWRERLLRWLHVPAEPAAPAGDEGVRVFRAAPGYFRYRVLRWLLTNAGAAVGLLFALQFSGAAMGVGRMIARNTGIGSETLAATIVMLVEASAVLGFLLQAAGTLLVLRLDIDQRWYLVSDRSIRIREGIVRLHEKTMTLANVQHVSVRQGPLQRLLGIADVEIRTAGGGDNAEPGAGRQDMHVAWFRGVDNAAAIRDAVRERLRQQKNAGLGDPDDQAPAREFTLAGAAQELAREAALLRQVIPAAAIHGGAAAADSPARLTRPFPGVP